MPGHIKGDLGAMVCQSREQWNNVTMGITSEETLGNVQHLAVKAHSTRPPAGTTEPPIGWLFEPPVHPPLARVRLGKDGMCLAQISPPEEDFEGRLDLYRL